MDIDYETTDNTSVVENADLPFAIDEIDAEQVPCSPLIPTEGRSFYLTEHSSPPQLVGSIVSSPTDGESQNSFDYCGGSQLHTDSQYIEAAASLLLPRGSLLDSSSSPNSQILAPNDNRIIPGFRSSDQSVGFSQLMHQADNTQEKSSAQLPVLHEEHSLDSNNSDGNHLLETSPHTGNRIPEWNNRFAASQTILPASHGSIYTSEPRRLASLAGATALRKNDNTFLVSVDVSRSTPRDAMSVIGNIELLHHWCDPVQQVIVTNATECGVDAAAQNREYEGRWIEATSTQLVLPPNTSCWYSTFRLLSSTLGFPSYGKITIFTEQQRGQVSLTIGPFPGDVEVLHKIRAEEFGGRTRIEDTVCLQRSTATEPRCCGLSDMVESYFLPTLDDYMDQVLTSMARLRFLVENGGTTPNVNDSPSAPLLD